MHASDRFHLVEQPSLFKPVGEHLAFRREVKDRLTGSMRTPSGSKPVATRLESRFPLWLPGVFDACLHGALGNGGDPQGSQFAVLFGENHAFDWAGPPRLSVV